MAHPCLGIAAGFVMFWLAGAATAAPQTIEQRGEVATWPQLSADEQAFAVKENKAFAATATLKTDRPTRLFETDFFLFYTDLPRGEAKKWAGLLDRMYHRLCKLFAIKRGTNIWRGKALIFVYSDRQGFSSFEQNLFDTLPSPDQIGVCHSYSTGDVVVSFFRQKQEMEFAQVLVHETVHGFLHRYRSPPPIASWANEGLADLIADELVPKGKMVAEKQRWSRKLIRKSQNLGGNFFTAKHIDGWQYGVASDLTAFMIRKNRRGYVAFIKGIKEGLPWEESLEKYYGLGVDRLTQVYGRSLNIRSLKP